MHLEARDVGQLLKCVGTQFSPVQECVCFVINPSSRLVKRIFIVIFPNAMESRFAHDVHVIAIAVSFLRIRPSCRTWIQSPVQQSNVNSPGPDP